MPPVRYIPDSNWLRTSVESLISFLTPSES